MPATELNPLINAARHDSTLGGLLVEAKRKAVAKRAVSAMRSGQHQHANAMERYLVTVFDEMGKHIEPYALHELERHSNLWEASLKTDVTLGDRENLVNAIMTASHIKDWARGRLSDTFFKWYDLTTATTSRKLQQAGLATNLRGPVQARVIAQGGRRAGLVDIVGDTRAALFRALDQSIEAGIGPRATAKAIRDIVPEGRFVNAGSRYRAQLIARTETLHAQRVSALESYRTTQSIKKVIAFDGDSDPDCAERDGQVFTLDEAEAEMNSDTVHPNCVLAFGPYVE